MSNLLLSPGAEASNQTQLLNDWSLTDGDLHAFIESNFAEKHFALTPDNNVVSPNITQTVNLTNVGEVTAVLRYVRFYMYAVKHLKL